MHHFLRRVLCLALLLPAVSASAAPDKRPNLLIILADDLGYNDVGFTGPTEIQTPRLDELAANGVIFSNGYVTHPYCGPSRAGLITGRHQARFGKEVNIPFSPFDPHAGLPVSERTFAKRLQPAGYRTGMIGKWHLGAAPPFHPNNRGFDHFFGFLGGARGYFPQSVSMTTPLVNRAGKSNHSGNNGSRYPLMLNDGFAPFDEYLTTALSRDAASFVQEGDQPFCLYLAYNAPHTPLQAPEELVAKYADIQDPKRRTYAAMVDAMDAGIGMVIDALRASGKLDNTLVFFFSDNGGPQAKPGYAHETFTDNAPFRGGKGSMVEGGTHVPFIAHWPRGLPAGVTYAPPVSALDVAATFVALGRGDASGPPLEGKNLIPYVLGEEPGPPHAALFFRMRDTKHWAVRTPEAKLLLPRTHNAVGEAGEPELYDMVNDPYETTNLVHDRPGLRARLAGLWNDWNAGNIPNRFTEIARYQRLRLKMYDDLRAKSEADAAKVKPTIVE